MNLKRIDEVGDVAIVVDADTGNLYSLNAIEGLKEAIQALKQANKELPESHRETAF